MSKVKILIVEDDALIAADIAEILINQEYEVIGICGSGEEATSKVDEDKPDIVLMDIKLQGKLDGIQSAQIIKKNHQVPVIFLSDFTDKKTVDRAKVVFPANYLSKPFNEIDLIRAIDLAFHNTYQDSKSEPNHSGSYAFLKEGYRYIKVKYDDIIMLKADRAYCILITQDQTFHFSKTLIKISEQLNYDKFYRVHRSYIINMDKISEINGNIIRLSDHQAELSKNNRDSFLAKLRLIK